MNRCTAFKDLPQRNVPRLHIGQIDAISCKRRHDRLHERAVFLIQFEFLFHPGKVSIFGLLRLLVEIRPRKIQHKRWLHDLHFNNPERIIVIDEGWNSASANFIKLISEQADIDVALSPIQLLIPKCFDRRIDVRREYGAVVSSPELIHQLKIVRRCILPNPRFSIPFSFGHCVDSVAITNCIRTSVLKTSGPIKEDSSRRIKTIRHLSFRSYRDRQRDDDSSYKFKLFLSNCVTVVGNRWSQSPCFSSLSRAICSQGSPTTPMSACHSKHQYRRSPSAITNHDHPSRTPNPRVPLHTTVTLLTENFETTASHSVRRPKRLVALLGIMLCNPEY